MTRSPSLSTISCTQCGAGLPILGGGRVTTHVCGYCGAELDALENYRVLRQFTGLDRPASPFAIGMTGAVMGVEFTIIGTLGLSETYNGQNWTWVDHLLFSPTHGYAWLTVEDGHVIFTRRYRKGTLPTWLTESGVENAESPPVVHSGGRRFKYYETSNSQITFAEGEFTYTPAIGDRALTISALADDAMLHFTQTKTEREVELSVYPDQAATFAAFGADWQTPATVHPLQPYVPAKNEYFFALTAAIFAVLAGIASLWFLIHPGTAVLPTQSFATRDLPVEVQVPITETGRLATVTVGADVYNAWAWLEVTMTDPEDQPIFEVGREVGFYTGTDADGAWSEGNRTSTFRFHPTTSGTYTLELSAPEGGTGETTGPLPMTSVTLSVRQGLSSALWTLLLTLGFGGLAVYHAAASHKHNWLRWRGTDWTD